MLHACGMPPSDADMIHGSGATVGGLLMQASKAVACPCQGSCSPSREDMLGLCGQAGALFIASAQRPRARRWGRPRRTVSMPYGPAGFCLLADNPVHICGVGKRVGCRAWLGSWAQ